MLFNSYVFLCLFLPLVLIGWWKVFRNPTHRLIFLTLSSYVFYSYFQFPLGLKLLPLLITSTLMDYTAGHVIHRAEDPRRRKHWLVVALVLNLGLLGIFKYLGFFETTVNGILSLFGQDTGVPVHEIILPVGISFYTFNSMSYTIDIYRRKVQPAKNLAEYAAFVSLFPHLVAGPIVRYSDIDWQLRDLKTRLTSHMAMIGVFFFSVGLFKKIVIADSVAPTVDRLFANADQLTMVSGWAAMLGYAFQLYFDFSAYSDMAVGLAMFMGLRFPQNFDSPYKALNISDFWRRWHMSLSSWLRDYLYFALGGNRNGTVRTLRNLMIVMFLGGLWHGAAWTFVLWGLGHGIALVIHNVARSMGYTPKSVWVNRALTFIVVCLLWICFRAPDFTTAADVYAAVFGLNGVGLDQLTRSIDTGVLVPVMFFVQLLAMLIFVNVAPNTFEVNLRPTRLRAVALAVAASTSVLLMAAPSPFLYFQF